MRNHRDVGLPIGLGAGWFLPGAESPTGLLKPASGMGGSSSPIPAFSTGCAIACGWWNQGAVRDLRCGQSLCPGRRPSCPMQGWTAHASVPGTRSEPNRPVAILLPTEREAIMGLAAVQPGRMPLEQLAMPIRQRVLRSDSVQQPAVDEKSVRCKDVRTQLKIIILNNLYQIVYSCWHDLTAANMQKV